MMGGSVCCKCKRIRIDCCSFYPTFYPIQPRGTKNRQAMCELCLRQLPKWKAHLLLWMGRRRTLRIVIWDLKYDLIQYMRGEEK